MQKTGIEYLTHTWNLIAMRCTKCSPGCEICWHLTTADRLCNNMSLPEDERMALGGTGPFVLRQRELSAPSRTKKPAVIGVQFMGDLFHEGVPYSFIEKAYMSMIDFSHNKYLILTKRPKRMAEWVKMNWANNCIWHGLTVCNQAEADEKIPIFLQVPGKKFLSIEPMLEAIDIKDALYDYNWHVFNSVRPVGKPKEIDAVILGGETLGNRPGREMKTEWVENIVGQCTSAGVPLFIKQIHLNGKVSKNMNEWPEELRVRELPWLNHNSPSKC